MFKASSFEYRHRYLAHTVIYVLGFFAPWNYALHLDPPGPNAHLWGILSANLARLDIGSIATAFNLLLGIGIACAFAGAFLRTWGAAYLGANIVESPTMHTAQAEPATGILQDGPFRYVRNPLYLGTFLHTLALSLLMPRSGGIFCILAIGLVQLRLILAEEPFLSAKLGAPYAAYCALVPRIIPTLRPRVAGAGLDPRWPQAFLGEVYMWGVALSFAFTGWRYNAWLVTQCVIVSFGLSLVARAFQPKTPAA
jgi:protein-S-isoprenylcysteine O-methyltransferase Ste14